MKLLLMCVYLLILFYLARARTGDIYLSASVDEGVSGMRRMANNLTTKWVYYYILYQIIFQSHLGSLILKYL